MTGSDPDDDGAAAKAVTAQRSGYAGVARWLGLAGALVGLLLLVAPYDAAVAAWAATAPRGVVEVARVVTVFGKSGYMFAVSAASAAAAFALARAQADPRWQERLRRWGLDSLFFFASIAASGLLAQAIKHGVGRVRPGSSLPTTGPFTVHPFSLADAFASFPPGTRRRPSRRR